MSQNQLQSSIAGYRVLEQLASGATSDVFLAIDDEARRGIQDEKVTVKLLALQCGSEHERFGQLKAEIAAFRSLTATSIVRLKDALTVDEQCVLVLEHVPGVSLEKLIELLGPGERPDDAVLVYLMERLFAALADAHATPEGEAKPIVHGELRMSNVLLSWDGDVKLADFGITKIFHEGDGTAVSVLRSTSSYVSPEEAKGEAPTPTSDVYVASLLMWELFSAHVPEHRRARSPAELDAALKNPKIVALELLRPDLPRAICEVLGRGLEIDPAKRRITAAEVSSLLASKLPLHQGKAQLVDLLARWRPADYQLRQDEPEPAPQPQEVDRSSLFPTAEKAPADVFRAMAPAGEPARRAPRKSRQSTYPSFGPEAADLFSSEDKEPATDRELVGPIADGAKPAVPEPTPAAITPAAVAVPNVPERGGMSRAMGPLVIVAALLGVFVIWRFRSAPEETSTQASAPPATASAPVVEMPSVVMSASAAPVMRAKPVASAAPSASAAAAAGEAPAADMGDVVIAKSGAKGHRIYMDNKVIGSGEGTFRVACGKHMIKIGSSGGEEEVKIPCGGQVTVR